MNLRSTFANATFVGVLTVPETRRVEARRIVPRFVFPEIATSWLSAAASVVVANGGTKWSYEGRVLYLKPDGTYEFKAVVTKKTAKEAWNRFRFLLDYYNDGQQIKGWMK